MVVKFWNVTILSSCIMSHDLLITWHLMPGTDTWHLLSDTWRLTCYHLILDICYHLVLIHLTWCCDTWLEIITLDTCITLSIHEYRLYGDLTWLLYCYQTSGTPVFLNFYFSYTHIPSVVTLVNSTVIPASGGACRLASGWRGCIPWSCYPEWN